MSLLLPLTVQFFNVPVSTPNSYVSKFYYVFAFRTYSCYAAPAGGVKLEEKSLSNVKYSVGSKILSFIIICLQCPSYGCVANFTSL